MVIGRSVLRTEDKVDLLIRWFEQYIITGKPAEVKQLNPEPVDYWNLKHPYAMPPNFTGRVEERKILADWLNNDNENRLFILRALGGFGKSALSWHWLTHDVDSKQWTKLVWWSFYEGDASFEHFIEETLKYLKLEIPQGQRPQVDELLKAMQGQKILLIMDGFERALRAYSSMNAAYQGDEPKVENNQLDCVNINAEIFLKSVCSLPNIKSKVLMTTRLTPRAIKPRGEFMLGCREEELTAMQKADAVEFFHKQGIKGTHAEIEAACEPYGYHPLSLRILSGLIIDDRKTPGDISIANKLEITDDIIQNKHHVLEVGYNTLSAEQQKLLSTIACFRSPMNYDVLKEISNKPLGKGKKAKASSIEKLDGNLKTLETRGLLHWDRKANKYDLHPIVRRYAYERLTATDRTAAHFRLRDYFGTVDVPEKPQTINDLAPVIEKYHHTVQVGELDEAVNLLRERVIPYPLYFQFGAYENCKELLLALIPDGKLNLPRLSTIGNQVWTISALANIYSMSGQPRLGVSLWDELIQNGEKQFNKKTLAINLGNAAIVQLSIGELNAAESKLRQYIELSEENEEDDQIANGHLDLSSLYYYIGSWELAKRELNIAKGKFEKIKHVQMLGVTKANETMLIMLMIRDFSQSIVENSNLAINSAQDALNLAYETAHILRPHERDFVVSHWLLGAAYRLGGQLELAEQNLSEALIRDRVINLVELEANILLDLAHLRYDQKNYEEAKSLAEEALTITERCGYVLQGADVNLFLAQYALEQEKDKVKAKEYAETALKLATCDGPPYYYKVAYEEAERFLAQLQG